MHHFAIPSSFKYIFIALIPTILGVSGSGTFYAYERIVSMFLVLFGLIIFFNQKDFTSEDLTKCFEIFVFLGGVFMTLSLSSGRTANGRLVGIYENANFLSCLACTTMAGTTGLFFYLKGKVRRWVYFAFGVISIMCVIQAGSRIGLAEFLVYIIFLPFLIQQNRDFGNAFKTTGLLLLIIICLYYAVTHLNILGFNRLLQFQRVTGSLYSRGDTWDDVYKIFMAKPIFGWGYGAVGYNVFVNYIGDYHWGMHSSYFAVLCEMGIYGTLLFIGFFVSYLKSSAKLKKKLVLTGRIQFKQILFYRFLLITSLIVFINAYAEAFLFSFGNSMSICFWLPFVLISCYLYKVEEEHCAIGIKNP